MEAFNSEVGSASGPGPRVRASFRLGSQTYCVGLSDKDVPLSAALSSTKDLAMGILKEYIAAHNVPNDVPDEVDVSEGDEENDEIPDKPRAKSKKTKLS